MKTSADKKNTHLMNSIFAVCIFILNLASQAQNSCYDIDFESGTLNGWTTTGNVSIVSAGNDIYGGFPLSAPGGSFSVKVGSNTDPAASSLSKSFVVTSGNPILTYRYAMDILNYPHSSTDAGRIVIDVFDNNNVAIPCAHYEAFYSTSGGSTQGFLISPQPAESNIGGECCYDISYRPWTPLSVDLSPYVGQSVTLKATCHWCIYSVDWVYAYFDFGCSNYLIKQDTACNSVGALLIAPPDFQTYSWLGPGVVSGQTNDSAYVNQAGTYTVNMTTATGCVISKNITLTNVPSVVNASVTPNTGICPGGSVTLAASGGLTYRWLNTAFTASSLTVSPVAATTYTVEVKDIHGCTDTAQSTVTLFPKPIADYSPHDVCLNQPINFANMSSIPAGTITAWSWDFGDGSPMVFVQSPSHFYADTGTYSVPLIITSNKGCKDTAAKNVTVHPLPHAKFSSENVCKGSIVPFSDLSTLSGVDILQFWSWSFGDGSTLNNNQNTQHLYNAIGSYTSKLLVVSNFGCRDSITKIIAVNPNPVVNFSAPDTVGCDPLCVNFQNSSSIASGTNSSYLWTLGDGNTSLQAENLNHCYTNNSVDLPVTFSVSLTVTSDSGCVSALSKHNYITVNPNPIAHFTVDPKSVSIMNPVISYTDLSLGANIWNWDLGDHTTSAFENPLPHTYPDTGKYTVTLIVSNQYSCFDTAHETLVIEPDWAFYIPNMFSPNGDGINDSFQGYGYGLLEYEMFIFDRWGNNIFHTVDYDYPWDGKANGGKEKAQMDVYVYVINIKDIKAGRHSYKGIVTLVK